MQCAILSDVIAGADDLTCTAHGNFSVNKHLSEEVMVIGVLIEQLFQTAINGSHCVREFWEMYLNRNDL